MPALSDFKELLPPQVAREVVQSVVDEGSPLMALARRINMPTGTTILPVVSSPVDAGFVDPATGLKPHSVPEWEPLTLRAAEVGILVPLPDAFVQDATFSPWDSIRPEITKSFSAVFERAALYGTNAPDDWPDGGITDAAFAEVATGGSVLEAIDAACSVLEANGITPTAILGGGALRAAMRQEMVTILQPFDQAPASLYGLQVVTSPYWNDQVGVGLVGGFENVLAGIRQDLTWMLGDQAVISDEDGQVVFNAFQQDASILRCFWRIALAVAQPLGPAGEAVGTLALAKVGSASPASASVKRSSSKATG